MYSNSAIKIGYRSSNITTSRSIELGGYGYFLKRLSTGIRDRIFSKALCIEVAEKAVLLISNDLIGLSKAFCDSIIIEISKETSIPKENIVISSTHTHSAPATVDLAGCGKVDDKYMKMLRKVIIGNAIKATRKVFPTKIKLKKIKIDNFAINRSSTIKSSIQQDLTMFLFQTKSMKTLLVHFSCHACIFGNKNSRISKDYISSFEKFAKIKSYNNMIFFNGACSNILPLSVKKKTTTLGTSDANFSEKEFTTEIDKLIETIETEAKKVQWNDLDTNFLKINTRKVDIQFEIPKYYKDKRKMQKYYERCYWDDIDMKKGLVKGAKEGKSKNVISKSRRVEGVQKVISSRLEGLFDRISIGDLEKSVQIEIKLILLGKVKVLSIPFEIHSDFEKKVQEKYPNVLVFGYSNGLEGYIYKDLNNQNYARTRGSILYNYFPFKKDSFRVILKEAFNLLRTV